MVVVAAAVKDEKEKVAIVIALAAIDTSLKYLSSRCYTLILIHIHTHSLSHPTLVIGFVCSSIVLLLMLILMLMLLPLLPLPLHSILCADLAEYHIS